MLSTVRCTQFLKAHIGRQFSKSRYPQLPVGLRRNGTAARRSPASIIPLASKSLKAPLPPISPAAEKWIRDSGLFRELVFGCLADKDIKGAMVQVGAWTAIVLALLAWSVPTYWVGPQSDVEHAESLARGLLFMAALFLYTALGSAADFTLFLVRERRLMAEGMETFGDNFAAVVQDCRKGL